CRNCSEPPGLPELRQHLDGDSCAALAPNAVFVASPHLERVIPWREPAVARETDVTGAFGPIFFIPLHPILELPRERGRKVDTGVTNFNALSSRRHFQL